MKQALTYLATLRIESSYPLKPMYSYRKDFHSYIAKMLLPPPSTLNTIIQGPACTTMQQAKQAVRVKACRIMHEMGLLNDELLPCNLSPLVEMNKEHYTCSQERSQINDSIAKAIEHMRIQTGKFVSKRGEKNMPKKSKPAPRHLQPRPGPKKKVNQPMNEVGKRPLGFAQLSFKVPNKKKLPASYQPRYIAPAMRWNAQEPNVPPGLLVSQSNGPELKMENTEVTRPEEMNAESVRMETEEATSSSDIVSESVSYYPLKVSNLIYLKGMFQAAACLSSPYQDEITEGLCYIYSWRPAKSEVLATLLSVPDNAFTDTETCIGLLFSKPISDDENVCRVPVYLKNGMLRVIVKLEAKVQLSQAEISIIKDTHKVLATITAHYNQLEMFGPNFSRLWGHEQFRGLRELVEGPEKLKFAPTEARINGLYTLLRS
ncbi:hypothetical protein Ciccas_002451 [Cichlidogyrus casuarinus]|uniref:Dicer dsRNA-binding fold domain-containing protein n=1 Tax=Cichlidogyrus casuarinus TaxID=1844966 RepID=A0ABD2QH82_9PLAT